MWGDSKVSRYLDQTTRQYTGRRGRASPYSRPARVVG